MTKTYDLVGQDGNAWSLMGYTSNAMKEQGFDKAEIDNVMKNAMSSDYNNLIYTLDQAICVCNLRSAGRKGKRK
jgi:hypothetical protein